MGNYFRPLRVHMPVRSGFRLLAQSLKGQTKAATGSLYLRDGPTDHSLGSILPGQPLGQQSIALLYTVDLLTAITFLLV